MTNPALDFGIPQLGDSAFAMQRLGMYRLGFRDDVFGPDAANFIKKFVEGKHTLVRRLASEKQALCKGNDAALNKLAGKIKYLTAYIELALCYGKQIGIMSEHEGFRTVALAYIALIAANSEALENFDPARA